VVAISRRSLSTPLLWMWAAAIAVGCFIRPRRRRRHLRWAGNDTIEGKGGLDPVDAGGGDDMVSGGPGGDSFHGGEGADVLRGGFGGDVLRVEEDDDEAHDAFPTVHEVFGCAPGESVVALVAGH
jgi:hypothetical protein